MVGVERFELPTPCSQSRCANRTALYPEIGCKFNFFLLTITKGYLLSKEKIMKRLYSIVMIGFFVSLGISAQTQEVVVEASKDNSIFEEAELSNGAGEYIFTGKIRIGPLRRALVMFDISEVVPVNASVDSAVLVLSPSLVKTGGTTVKVHKLTADWGEGDSKAEGAEGKGIAASDGDATWTKTLSSGSDWASPGGDYVSNASASTIVNLDEESLFSSTDLTANVIEWHANPSDNFGWIVIGDESTTSTAIRFSSRENATVSARPQLKIYYQETISSLARELNTDNIQVHFDRAGTLVIRNNFGSLEGRVELYSITGALLHSSQQHLPEGESRLGTGIQNSGIYLYRIISDAGIPSGKLVFNGR